MQCYHIAAGGLQVEKLMNVGNIRAGDDPRAPSIGVMGPYVSLRRPLEHRLGQRPFDDFYDAYRTTVIVNGCPLSWPPAQKQ